MRILLLGMGSRGDVEPMLALGARLAEHGHEPVVAAAIDFRDLVLSRGLGYEPLSLDVRAGATTDLGRTWLGGSSSNQQREAYLMRRVVRLVAAPLAGDVLRLVPTADAVVTSALTLDAALPVAERAGVRVVHTMFQPTWPTAWGPSSVFALRPQARSRLNAAWSWGAAYAAFDIVRATGDIVRRRLAAPRTTFRAYVESARHVPTLLAASRHVVPPAAEWGDNLTRTGFWFAPGPEGWEPPDDLAAFLDAGDPPVLLGFGSMATDEPAQAVAAFAEALAHVGRRGLVSAGWAGLHAEDLPDTVRVVGDVPYAWLFPRLAAVVHHGGAGTTAAAFRAGVPQVVVPHIADQPYWGRRVAELGVGAEPIRRRHLTPGRLAPALRTALSERVTAAARSLGVAVAAEDGVGKAARVVEEVLERGRHVP